MCVDIEDIEKHMPGFMNATVGIILNWYDKIRLCAKLCYLEWFRIYKIPDGKPPNEFAFLGDAKPREFALEVIEETHEHWKKMVAGQVDCHGVNR